MKRKFTQGLIQPPSGGIPTGNTIRGWITTGTKRITLQIFVTCELAGALIQLLEGSTQGAGGVAVTPVNLNRVEGDDPDFTLNVLATQGAAGDIISTIDASGNEAMSPLLVDDFELAPSTTYEIAITNNNAGTNRVGINYLITQDA